ncbi:hypothetical protein ABFX02_08G125200 [Erythranthe guttata]
MASSSCSVEPIPPPWEKLPPEITAVILQKLGAMETLTVARKVCPTWRRVSEEYPSIWRCIDMQDPLCMYENIETMCRRAVDHSQGQLIEFKINGFGTSDTILYVSQRSSQLKRLQIVNCHCISFSSVVEAIKKFPLLEELHLQLDFDSINVKGIETIGKCCPLLNSLNLRDRKKKLLYNDTLSMFFDSPVIDCDNNAVAIAGNMQGLRQLCLIGSKLTDVGLQAILRGCPNLVSLDIRGCYNVFESDDVEQLCFERINEFKGPDDSMDDDYEYDYDNRDRFDDNCDYHYYGIDFDDEFRDPDDFFFDNEYALGYYLL